MSDYIRDGNGQLADASRVAQGKFEERTQLGEERDFYGVKENIRDGTDRQTMNEGELGYVGNQGSSSQC